MTMSHEESDDREFGMLERTWAGIVGGILLGGGALSVFTDVNEAGSVALIATGGFFGFLAVSGQTLRKLRFGDSEAEFNRRVTREVTERVQHGAPGQNESEVAAQILEQAANESSTTPSRVINTTNAFRYERSVLAALRRVASDYSIGAPDDTGLDARVNGDTGVVVKYRGAGRPPGLRALQEGGAYHSIIARAARLKGVSRVLIVTNSAVGEDAQDPVAAFQPGSLGAAPVQVKLVHWTPDLGDDPLEDALLELGSSGTFSAAGPEPD